MAKRFKMEQGAVCPPIDGVIVKDGFIEFPESFSDADIEAVRKQIQRGSRKSYSFQEAGNFKLKSSKPSDEDKSLIKSRMKGEIDIDSFGVYTFVAAESIKDRQRDVLTKGHLEWMAEKYKEGRPLADGHEWDYRVGKTFDAKVVDHESAPGEYQLEVKAYVLPETKTISGNFAKMELDAGIVDRVSVAFSSPIRFLEADHADNVWGGPTWIFDRPKDDSNAEVFELSLVTMGAQSGAKVKGEKGGIEKKPTFEKTEIKPDKIKMEFKEYTSSVLNKTIKTAEEAIEAIKELEAKSSELEQVKESLKVYTDKEAELVEVKVKELVNLKVQVYKVDADKETAKVKKLSLSEIEDEIGLISKSSLVKQTKPGGGGSDNKNTFEF